MSQSPLVKIKTPLGDCFINPHLIAMISPLQDQTGVAVLGRCALHTLGGAVLPFPASPEAMAKALWGPPDQPPPAQPGTLARLN